MHLHNIEQRYKQELRAKEEAEKASKELGPSKTINRGKKRDPSKTKGRHTTEQGCSK
jgi:hypothetical protein